MSVEDLGEAATEDRPSGGSWASGARLAVALLVFLLGLVCGIPLAMFSMDMIVANAVTVFTLMFGLLLIAAMFVAVIVAFRRPLLQTVVRRSEVEMERFARPLAEVARHAAEQNVRAATDAAREVGELMLARFAWVSTRRWMVATITAFVAAIAALSGSVLLLQQNRLLQEQTDRIVEQNSLISQQIELGEAERSTSIVPEILAIGEALGAEVAELSGDGRTVNIFDAEELSAGLRARIIAATTAARPYRYLDSALTRAGDAELNALALDRRDDLTAVAEAAARWRAQEAEIYTRDASANGDNLIDRPVSPERGQLLTLMFNLGVMSTEPLSYYGADFSFAELRLQSFGVMSLRHALLRFADFSGTQIREGQFGAAYLEQARFRRTVIGNSHFSGLANDAVELPFAPAEGLDVWHTQMAGTDFAGSVIFDTDFRAVNAIGARFDYTLLQNVDFTGASLSASTFRNAIIGDITIANADLRSVEFDDAFVFSEDFLDTLAENAAPDTFRRDRYRLEPATREDLEDQPAAIQLWQIPNYPDGVDGIWRIVRQVSD